MKIWTIIKNKLSEILIISLVLISIFLFVSLRLQKERIKKVEIDYIKLKTELKRQKIDSLKNQIKNIFELLMEQNQIMENKIKILYEKDKKLKEKYEKYNDSVNDINDAIIIITNEFSS